MEANTPSVEDQNTSPPAARGKYYIAPDISDEDLELRYAEHHENNPLKTEIVVNEEGTATVVTSHSLGEDGNWKAQEVVLDHTHLSQEAKNSTPADDPLYDFEKLIDEELNIPEPDNLLQDNPQQDNTQQDNTQQDDSTAKISKYHKKRLTSLDREKESMLRKCQEFITEQKSLSSPSSGAADTRDHDPGVRRRNILAELKAFALGLQSVRWEKKKATLEENIAFAATPEGIALEEIRKKEAREKERQKKRDKKTKAPDKLGRYNVLSGEESEGKRNGEGRGRGKGKFGSYDSHRVVKRDGEGRWGSGRLRGGRGGRRNRGRGGPHDTNEGPGQPN